MFLIVSYRRRSLKMAGSASKVPSPRVGRKSSAALSNSTVANDVLIRDPNSNAACSDPAASRPLRKRM